MTITRAARDLQSAANRLALMTRNHNRDTILAVLMEGTAKGQRAADRLKAQAPAMAALEEEVQALRQELGNMLDTVLPARMDPAQMTEPPTKKRKKS